MRSPALISTCSKAGCYAVLASLSGRYPPLEGRSPTCYSPVCHSTCPLRGFRVRLACVRHAASVDSEPGSNSQVKVVGPGPKPGAQLVQPDRLLNWLSDLEPALLRPTGLSPRLYREKLAGRSQTGSRQVCRQFSPLKPWPKPKHERALPADTRQAVLARSI